MSAQVDMLAERLAKEAKGPLVKLLPEGFVIVCPRPPPPLLFDLVTKLTNADPLTDIGSDSVSVLMATNPVLATAWQSLSTDDKAQVYQRALGILRVQPLPPPEVVTTPPPPPPMPCTKCRGAQEIKNSNSQFATMIRCPQCGGTGYQP